VYISGSYRKIKNVSLCIKAPALEENYNVLKYIKLSRTARCFVFC